MAQQSSIAVDPASSETDDQGYESCISFSTSTRSMRSSVNEYMYENGRRYHSYYGVDKNFLPTDEEEQDRLDMHHEILLCLLSGELYKAPLENPRRILDIGTGTGIWAIDMAENFPLADVLGIDLSPIQPKWVPPNCRFEVDDAELEWLRKPNSFDFIHARNIAQAISDWPKLVSEIYKCTAPGGYVELAELGGPTFSDDGSLSNDNPLHVFTTTLCMAMEKIGRPFPNQASLTALLEQAGFVGIVGETFKQPLGPWPLDRRLKQAGAIALRAGNTGYHAYGMGCFTRILGMGEAESDKLCWGALHAVRNKNTHAYNEFYVVYAKKPLRA